MRISLLQQEEMLISPVLPIVSSLYHLPHEQYTYSRHVINLPHDVNSFVNYLPRLPMMSLSGKKELLTPIEISMSREQ